MCNTVFYAIIVFRIDEITNNFYIFLINLNRKWLTDTIQYKVDECLKYGIFMVYGIYLKAKYDLLIFIYALIIYI